MLALSFLQLAGSVATAARLPDDGGHVRVGSLGPGESLEANWLRLSPTLYVVTRGAQVPSIHRMACFAVMTVYSPTPETGPTRKTT